MAPGPPPGTEVCLEFPPGVGLSVTGIPTDPDRRKQRGYDLPEEIFRPWCREAGYRWESLLVRNRPTRSQYGLTPEERKKNLKGCFTLVRQEDLPDIVLLCEQRCLRLIQFKERCA